MKLSTKSTTKKPLDARLYSPLQVEASQGRISESHPSFYHGSDAPWNDKPGVCNDRPARTSGQPPCYLKCGRLSVGWSAYCSPCSDDLHARLRATRTGKFSGIQQEPTAGYMQCSLCWEVFSNEGTFDRHRWISSPVSLLGDCRDPAVEGLEMWRGVWGTPEGNSRARTRSAGMAAVRSLRGNA